MDNSAPPLSLPKMVSVWTCAIALLALIFIGVAAVLGIQIAFLAEANKLKAGISPDVQQILENPDGYLADRLEAKLPELAQKTLRATLLGMSRSAGAAAEVAGGQEETQADEVPSHSFKTRDCNMNNQDMCMRAKETCTLFWTCQVGRDVPSCLPLIDVVDGFCNSHTSAMYKDHSLFTQVDHICSLHGPAMVNIEKAREVEREMTALCKLL